MKIINKIFDNIIIVMYTFLFLYNLIFFAILDITPYQSLLVAGHIFGGAVSFILLAILICLVSLKNIFISYKPKEFTKSFRVAIFIQLIINILVFKDYFHLPNQYGNFDHLPLRYYLINSGPILIWILRVFFKRIQFIENK